MDSIGMIKSQPIHYRKLGRGQPVVCIHGFAEDGRVWDALIPFLENDFMLLIPDLPGSGASPLQLPQNGAPTMESMAKSVADILEREECIGRGTDMPLLVGHSMGGYVALAFAASYPDKWKGLVLFHSTARADSPERKHIRAKNMAFLRLHGSEVFLKNTVPHFFSPYFQDKYPEKVDLHLNKYLTMQAECLALYQQAMIRRPDSTSWLQSSAKPIGFLWGRHDTLLPPDLLLKEASLPQNAYFAFLEHSGHMGMIEEPEAASAFLKNFFQMACKTT